MNIDEFITANRCKYLYHISEKGSWPNIQKLGLLSTSALLDLCGATGAERFNIESQLRTRKVLIKHPTYGDIYIRDQYPMQDAATPRRICAVFDSDIVIDIHSFDLYSVVFNRKLGRSVEIETISLCNS